MVNPDIITALKNAIEHGEPLKNAMDTLISSGYSPKDVQEASNFVGGGVTTYLNQNPPQNLVMPNQKNISPRPQPQMMPVKPVSQINSPQQIPARQNLPMNKPQPIIKPLPQNTFKNQPISSSSPNSQIRPINLSQAQQTQNNQMPQLNYNPQQNNPQTTQPLVQNLSQINSSSNEMSQENQNQTTYSSPISFGDDSSNLSNELEKMSSPNSNYTKEIILGAILVLLLITLGLVIVFRDKITGLFS